VQNFIKNFAQIFSGKGQTHQTDKSKAQPIILRGNQQNV